MLKPEGSPLACLVFGIKVPVRYVRQAPVHGAAYTVGTGSGQLGTKPWPMPVCPWHNAYIRNIVRRLKPML